MIKPHTQGELKTWKDAACTCTRLQIKKTKGPSEMVETREEKRRKEETSGLTTSQNC